jgi:hypothetical protein
MVASLALLFLLLCVGSASAQTASSASDPCLVTAKSSTPFFLQGGGFQQVIQGVPNKRILVCSVVFYGHATSGFNISFAGSNSSCTSGFTFFGSLFTSNDVAVNAGTGSSTQFTVPTSNNFCIELGGVGPPLESGGWITYVYQ